MPLVSESRRRSLKQLGLCACALPWAPWAAANVPLLLPDVTARYRLRLMPGSTDSMLYFYRLGNHLHRIHAGIEEVWLRTPNGDLRFERIFLAERRGVFYTAGELAALGVEAQWDSLHRLWDPRQAPPAERRALEEGLWQWEGQRDGHLTRVQFSERLQLPQSLVRGSAGSQTEWQLQAHATQPQAGWPQPWAGGQSLDWVDAADLGDMSYDPFARKAEAADLKAGWRQPHEH